MNRLSIYLVTALLALSAHAEKFIVDPAHAEIGFAVKHMMVSNTKGSFNTFEGSVEYDMASQTLKAIQGSIDAASIDTNSKKRDEHLRNADFFRVVKFPKITFASTSIKKTGPSTFDVHGTLNILGIDRNLILPVTINGPVDGRRGGKIIGLECSTVLNRRDLGITHAPAAVIGDEVKISIDAEAVFK